MLAVRSAVGRAAARWALVAASVAGQACGPSVQAIYEGNIRFEHCYKLDLDREVAPNHRRLCWEQWVNSYSYGQTRDRLEYAKRRLRYLNAGETSAPGLDLSADASAPDVVAVEAPVPTSPHRPPPPVATPPTPPPSTRAAPPPVAPLPQRECTDDCAEGYRLCVAPCYGGGQVPSECIGCEKDYHRCMQRCFK